MVIWLSKSCQHFLFPHLDSLKGTAKFSPNYTSHFQGYMVDILLTHSWGLHLYFKESRHLWCFQWRSPVMDEFDFYFQLKDLNRYRELLNKIRKVSKVIKNKRPYQALEVREMKQTQNKQINNTKFLPISNRDISN